MKSSVIYSAGSYLPKKVAMNVDLSQFPPESLVRIAAEMIIVFGTLWFFAGRLFFCYACLAGSLSILPTFCFCTIIQSSRS